MLGQDRASGEITFTVNQVEQELQLDEDSGLTWAAVPLTWDSPQEPTANQVDEIGTSLSDIVGSEYICDRIIGHQFVHRSVTINNDATPVPTDWACVTAMSAIFVARAGDSGVDSGAENLPIGWQDADGSNAGRDYNPLLIDSIREPWMMRKQWLLGRLNVEAALAARQLDGTPASGLVINDSGGMYPENNVSYGTLFDHQVDVKSKRHVRLDERLWWVVAAMPAMDGEAATSPTHIHFLMDVRIHGRIVKARQRGSF